MAISGDKLIRKKGWCSLFEYSQNLAVITEGRAGGLSLDQVAVSLDRALLSPGTIEKRSGSSSRVDHGVHAIEIPYMGGLILCPLSLSDAFVRAMILDQIEPMAETASTIIEFGAGAGLLSALIARKYPKKTVVAADFEPLAAECVQALSEIGGLRNLHAEVRDLTRPRPLDAGCMVLSVGAIVVLPDAGRAALKVIKDANCGAMLFEPIGHDLGSKLMSKQFQQFRGLDRPVWDTILKSGVTLGRVIPDMIGNTRMLPLSLVEITAAS